MIKKNAVLKSETNRDNSAMKSRDEAMGISEASVDVEILSLSQNGLNPFSERTPIDLSIPENVHTASVFFYDMSGKQVGKRTVTERTKTSLSRIKL